MRTALIILCLITFLSGCGQSGKLYLPKKPTAVYDPNDTEGRMS